jgi:alpha-aminoadipate/glutamate carrier protein LysW
VLGCLNLRIILNREIPIQQKSLLTRRVIFFIRRMNMSSIVIECPECGVEIELENVVQNEIIVCPDCGVELEIVSIHPLKVDLAPMEEEDWGE